ncbi:transcriptional antiterminator, BglG [Alkaliphilus metalliredigens QYMF]|uniref:Transcriptional antiterminator, BglG n=1 Tax=Alkaliphilus metalliredigens (strain QYMF) TaxID=293826 RepID=A6TVY0_ALKMQ|nr:BglG family transcription antiterminator [Alkaliphilus metalliredigens]ABR50348.1 transcriptional antiterminator, BglG [Alkaliphilus metalliredigens QYMF]
MKQMKMTTRKKDILYRLCKENDYVTISNVAQDLNVSSRTVLRELEEIGKWLEKEGVFLDKKTGVGIHLPCSLEKKEELLELIEHANSIKIFTPQERQTIIASELLQANEPIKFYYLTKILNVSEGTISHDLDKLEEWVDIYNLQLIRKPGLGVYIAGREKHKRRAIINLIYENVEEKQLLSFIQENITKSPEISGSIEIKTRNRLLNLIDKETIRTLEGLIYIAEEEMGYKLADSAYVGLIVHLALAIKRIKNNEIIIMDKEFLNELNQNPEFIIARKLALNLSDFFNIDIHEDEIGYITMHLMGSKNRGNVTKNETSTIGSFELVKLAREMIKIAEAETGSFIGNNEKLLTGLVNHLEPAIKRIKMKMDIRNPLLQEIKTRYPHLIKVSSKCAKVLEDYLGQKMPESEIAYIAMHLGAVIEKKEIMPQIRFRVAVACPSGIGTSKLLATRIEKEYDNMHVVGIISSFRLEESWLKQEEIDFIISTIPIEKSSIPVIKVNPLLLDEDKYHIHQSMKKISKTSIKPKEKRKANVSLKDKLIQMHNYSGAIIEVLDNLFLETYYVEDIEELIHIVSAMLVKEKVGQDKLTQDLLSREKKGGTLISGKGFSLLHCRTSSVEKLYFGAVRLIKPIYYLNSRGEEEAIDLVIVMIAPENSKQAYLEVISEVSKMIIDKPNFLVLLRGNAKEEAYLEISNCLNDFYRHKSN